jgi:hypothetical protein
VPPLLNDPVGHAATHWPALQMPFAHWAGAEHVPPSTTRQVPPESMVPAGQAHALVVAFHKAPTGVVHPHSVPPKNELVELGPHCVQGGWPLGEK